jgi:glucosamine-6-phosphate deaminase
MIQPIREFQVDKVRVEVYPSKLDTSRAAATKAATILRHATSSTGRARTIVGAGTSQEDMVRTLVEIPDIEWGRIEVFQMDEFVGMPAASPAGFNWWLKTYLVDFVHPGQVHYLVGDAPDLREECRRYTTSLQSAPIDLCFLGIGVNGHIGFNDPHVADFHDPLAMKQVSIDETARLQQVGEGRFPNLEAVPRDAVTLTCPVLVNAEYLVCCVPERRKADAIRKALEGPISEACPSSLIRTHSQATLYLDAESASLLS